MERWVLEGDSYSFLRSAPHTFNLQNREGPNRVEIFDITSIPSHRNAISETTCLCDIFGDDGESLSSSPASATFIRKEVEQAYPAEDADDSLESYHTAEGSDLSDTTDAPYNTPSPKDLQDFFSVEICKPHLQSTNLSDAKNGFDHSPLVRGGDLSKTDYWEQPQVNTAPVDEMNKDNPLESLRFNSLPSPNSISPNDPSNEKVHFEEEGNSSVEQLSTPVIKHTTSESLHELQIEPNYLVSFESAHSHTHQDFIGQQEMFSYSSSKWPNGSPTFADFTPVPALSSPVGAGDSTCVSAGKSSPEVSKECLICEESASESPELEKEIEEVVMDSKAAFAVSIKTREQVFNGKDGLKSHGLKVTCSSSPADSPEPVMIRSHVVQTLNPSPTTDKKHHSSEHNVSSSKVFRSMVHSEICSTTDYSEQATNVVYSISPCPSYERGFDSTEPESSPPSNKRGDDSTESVSPSPSIERGVDSAKSVSPSLSIERGVYSTESVSPSPSSKRGVDSTEPVSSFPSIERRVDSTESMSLSPSNKRGVDSTEPVSPFPSTEIIIDSTKPESPSPSNKSEVESISPSPSNKRGVDSAKSVSQSPLIERGVDSTELVSPSPSNKRGVDSTEPVSSSPSVERRVNSTESMSLSPSNDRGVDSTEPVSPSPSIEIMIDSTHSESLSPSNKSEVDSTESVSPSPSNKRVVDSTESVRPSPSINRRVYSTESISFYPSNERGVDSIEPVSPSPSLERRMDSTEPESSSPSNKRGVDSVKSVSLCPSNKKRVHSTESLSRSPPNEKCVDSSGLLSPSTSNKRGVSLSSSNERGVGSTESLSPFPSNKREVDSTEPISPTPSYERGIDSTQTVSPSPTNETRFYSTDPGASSHFCDSDIYSPSKHSVSAPSPEPVSHSPVDCTINPSANEWTLYSVEPDDLLSSSILGATDYTPTCSRESTPALRSILSTPLSRDSYFSPEPNSPVELRSITCSPEIKAVSYSILPHMTESAMSGHISPNNNISGLDTAVFEYSSETSNSIFENDVSLSPSLRNDLLTPESRSRLSSAASDLKSDFALISDQKPEPSMLFNKAENPFSHSHMATVHFDGCPDRDISVVSGESEVCRQVQSLNNSPTELSEFRKKDFNQETETDNANNSTIYRSTSLESSAAVLTAFEDVEHDYDHEKVIQMLENNSPGNNMEPGQAPAEQSKISRIIYRDTCSDFDHEKCWVQEGSEREAEREETLGESSYRGEQVELSFSTRNRKGLGNHSTALLSRDLKSGIPTRCYFESPPTTLQQQCALKDRGSKQDSKSSARRLKSAAEGNYHRTRFHPESSNMGSEVDEADKEVKWLTDVAFRSISSPQVDYLDVYNSSHHSSTNVSQPSTTDSPGAVAWMTYADLRGSTLHENDTSTFLTCDQNRHFEMSNFECVDVALESKEECNIRKRTVPKRQIQLLRRNTEDTKHIETADKILNSPSLRRHSHESFVRQNSTPVSMDQDFSTDSPQIMRKRTVQKSLSLDDGSPKTQRASCIIKSVLTRKMQDTHNEATKSTDPSSPGDHTKHSIGDPSTYDSISGTIEKHSSSSSQHSECTLSSEEFAAKEERVSLQVPKKCAPKVPPKPLFRPSFLNTDESLIADTKRKEGIKHRVASSQSDYKMSINHNSLNNRTEQRGDNLKEKYNSDITNACVRNTGPAIPTISMQSKSKGTKNQVTTKSSNQLDEKSVFMSNTSEITLKPLSTQGKKTASLKLSMSQEKESQLVPKAAEEVSCKNSKESKEADEDKVMVMHKVRDVRKLVKNTYNLSFKASNPITVAEEIEKTKNPQPPTALQIECKAVSWKDKQTAIKANLLHGEQLADKPKMSQPQVDTETIRDCDITDIPSAPGTQPELKGMDTKSPSKAGLPAPETITTKPSIHCDQTVNISPRPPIEEQQVLNSKSKARTFESTDLDSSQLKAANSSHSVSMLLKEKGMQADIGVCDVQTEGARAKHVNKLEVPVQACLSEVISSGTTSRQRTSRESESPNILLTEELPVKEQTEKKIMSTTTVTQIPTYLAISSNTEVKPFASNSKTAPPINASKEIELPIQVRSVSTDKLKQFVPSKPNYKHSFAEIKAASSNAPKAEKQVSSIIKPQARLSIETTKNELQMKQVQKEKPKDSLSRDPKKLTVFATSSYKPSNIPIATDSSAVQKSTTMIFASPEMTLKTTRSSEKETQSLNQTHIMNSSGSKLSGQNQSVARASSSNNFCNDDYLCYASDDPPSYDERERFSPVKPSDLPPHSSCRYHPSTKQTPCSCPPSSRLHQGNTIQDNLDRPPVASCSPGQVISCPGAPPQAQVRPRQCRPDGLQVSNPTIPHASALIQPLHKPRAHTISSSQVYDHDQPQTAGLHMDRRPANHPSPQAVASASYHEYSHSANMPAIDTRSQLYHPQDLPPSFAHDYANEGPGGTGVFYQENSSCGQGSRRVLLDPETGKYFYIEVPMQPLRKMLFDPEVGQYVEVLIPQQTMSHSGLYPPAAPPYSSLHSPGMYAPQFLPYAMPSYPGIPGSGQQGRHPDAPPALHQPCLRYGSPGGQIPKNEPKGHTSLDQSYLESMYYIRSGMNASPNSTTSDCYHKPSGTMPPQGGRRA